MSAYTDLADMLEEAARRLREADGLLSGIQNPRRSDELVSDLPGYQSLSVRTRKCLRREDYFGEPIHKVGQLCSLTAEQLLSRRNFGSNSLKELRNFLTENGLRLRGE